MGSLWGLGWGLYPASAIPGMNCPMIWVAPNVPIAKPQSADDVCGCAMIDRWGGRGRGCRVHQRIDAMAAQASGEGFQQSDSRAVQRHSTGKQ